MKKRIIILGLGLALATPMVLAQSTECEDVEIHGKWKVWAESPGMDKEKKMVDNIWEFRKDCILHAISEDPRTKTLDLETKYFIQEGAVMKQKVGRPDKYDHCGVEKTGDEMILKCPGLYFFMTKINN
ncbi:MAG: hypothetical protein RL637_431 [Pseudomonadota bacterium]